MLVWRFAKNKEITREEIDRALASITCFNCGKEYHTDECPFAKLRAELKALKETE
jgi:hypothetical protein